MAISTTLKKFMDDRRCRYALVTHPHAHSTRESAHTAGVPEVCVAKPVILRDEGGYLMAVLPSNRQIDLGEVKRTTGRTLRLAREDEFAQIFADCEVGAVPPIGSAFGMETMIDDSLSAQKEIYFEGGDHEELIRMDADQFFHLTEAAHRASFSR